MAVLQTKIPSSFTSSKASLAITGCWQEKLWSQLYLYNPPLPCLCS